MFIQGRHKQENTVAEAKLRLGRKKCFAEILKHFQLSRHEFCMFSICYVGVQAKKHFGNTEETLNLNVPRVPSFA